ncbi:MAG: EthD domain-containing protein [Deltaproteobacteria bacterium]|nr:EthD domain-containing protein [Deltaproteobacteria bacterium]
MKIIALIVRRHELARAEFRRHYEEVHAPLALRHFDQFSGYVRNHVAEEIAGGPAGFDCLTEFWYRDRAALAGVLAYLESPAAEPIRRDETTFMDKAANVFFPVEEKIVIAGDAAGAGRKIIMLGARAPGQPLKLFVRDWETALAAGLAAPPRPLRCVHNIAAGTGASPPPWDVVTMLWYAASFPQLAQRDRPRPGRCLIVRADQRITRLSPTAPT